MSANAIWYEKPGRFFFDGEEIRKRDLIARIETAEEQSRAAGKGSDQELDAIEVPFNYCTVTVGYLQDMLDFQEDNGWFFDVLDHTVDHRFDPANITPGTHWGEAQGLVAEATELTERATRLREDGDRRSAAQLKYSARQLLIASELRLMPGVSRSKRMERALRRKSA